MPKQEYLIFQDKPFYAANEKTRYAHGYVSDLWYGPYATAKAAIRYNRPAMIQGNVVSSEIIIFKGTVQWEVADEQA